MFKFLGVIFGFMSLNVLGAVLGFFLGSSLDRFFAYGAGAVNPLTSKQRQAAFLEAVFCLMGKLAKADGRITEDEIAHAELVMSRMGVQDQHRQDAIEFFRQGSQDNFDMESVLQKFLMECGHTHHLKQVLLGYLVTIALADGILAPSELTILKQIALRLGFNEAAFERMIAMMGAQSHFAGGKAPASANALHDAYIALGVSEGDTDAEIKKAYRRLMSQNHPDKLMGQGLPEDMIKSATEQSQEIQAAYELIVKHRK